jgi:S-formylglutathione hydrolase FrmB
MFYAASQELGVPVDYLEEDGKHDWYFWDKHIQRFLKQVLGESPKD